MEGGGVRTDVKGRESCVDPTGWDQWYSNQVGCKVMRGEME